MPIPPNAKALPNPMDPKDIESYTVDITRDDTGKSTLDQGEGVASMTLLATSTATAAGLLLKTGGGYAITLSGLEVSFWLEVAGGSQTSTTFDGTGLTLALELTITTDAVPPRVKQKTITVTVANQ